jgi:hypothetical protein
MPVPWDTTAFVPEATISVGASSSTGAQPSGWTTAAFNRIPVFAGGAFQVVCDGHEECDKTLYGRMDVIIAFVRNGGGASNFVGQQGGGPFFGAAPPSAWTVTSGSSFLTGTRNIANNGWVVAGSLSAADGSSTQYFGAFGNNINEIWDVAEPVDCGDVRNVAATTTMGGGSVSGGNGTVEGAQWSASLSAWFEVEADCD